jgi:multidrug efflux pump subunit AcrA (membrane-fusion protein)
MNAVSGAIKTLNVNEGQTVKSGDILCEIDSFQIEIQIQQMQTGIEYYELKLAEIERLFAFINNFTLDNESSRINPFDKNNISEARSYSNAQIFIDYIKEQEKAAGEKDPAETYTQSECDELKEQFLNQQYDAIDSYNQQIIDAKSKKDMYVNSLSEYTIKAAQDGVVHLSSGVTVGTVIQAGSLIGTISSANESDYYFETVISAADRARIKIDDYVETVVAGAIQSEFGVLKGKVVAIDTDSTQTQDGQVFYRVKIKPDTTVLKNKKGDEIKLKTGMLGESHIKYDETTWLKWIIEQIGVKFK